MKNIIAKIVVSAAVSVTVTALLNKYNRKYRPGVVSSYTFIKL